LTRTVILGLGNVAERIHIPACRAIDEIEIVGASETRDDRARLMKERFSLPRVDADSVALVDELRPDLVIVGTPPDSHFDLCMAAMERGADVLCEKPFVPESAQAGRLIDEARSRGRLLDVNTQYRHMPIYQVTRERLHAGAFGRLYYLQCWQQMFHPPAFEPLEWRQRLKKSTLWEFGAHPLDLITTFFDALPTSVTAHIPHARSEYDSDVLVQLTLTFPADRLATVSLNRVTHAPERYLEMRLDCEDASVRVSLGGVARTGIDLARNRGRLRPRLRTSFVKGGEVRVEKDARSTVLVREKNPAFASATASNLRAFLAKRSRRDASAYDDVEHARAILEIVEAGYRSAEIGRTVELNKEPSKDR